MRIKRFFAKELITKEINLENLNDVFSDMRKNKVYWKMYNKIRSRVIIIGGSGLIGSHLFKSLKKRNKYHIYMQ